MVLACQATVSTGSAAEDEAQCYLVHGHPGPHQINGVIGYSWNDGDRVVTDKCTHCGGGIEWYNGVWWNIGTCRTDCPSRTVAGMPHKPSGAGPQSCQPEDTVWRRPTIHTSPDLVPVTKGRTRSPAAIRIFG